MIRRYWLMFRQSRCQHTAQAKHIQRVSPERVEVRCEKCGKILTAPYGRALPVDWV